mmetsp:Transcript_18358/g.27198  ORF Transcript_18358/g.27198 Transcript_18358/m.27198 type:complete len:107 (+) Transcript_18358:48-368(+)
MIFIFSQPPTPCATTCNSLLLKASTISLATMSSEEVVLPAFGATGQNSKCVVKIAFERLGWKVKAMARSPSKLGVEHANLTLIRGDFSDSKAIRETVVDYLTSLQG